MTTRPRRRLEGNSLTGTVPSEMAALTALEVLYVRGALRRRALPQRLRATGRGVSRPQGGVCSDTRVYAHKWDMLSNEALCAWVVHLGIC